VDLNIGPLPGALGRKTKLRVSTFQRTADGNMVLHWYVRDFYKERGRICGYVDLEYEKMSYFVIGPVD